MSGKTTVSSRRTEARTVVKKAKNGELPKIGEYRLRYNNDEHTIAIKDLFVENATAEAGDDLPVFGDLVNGWAVIDLDGIDVDEEGDLS